MSFTPFIHLSMALALMLTLTMAGGAQPAHAQASTVALVPNPSYGVMLTDPDGWTLYTWDGDAEGVSNCYDACAAAWLPYTTDSDIIAPDGLPASLGLIDRGDGTWQVTLDNWPLYYFSRDANPGDVNGDGSGGFGATWRVVAFAGPTPVAQTPPPPPPPAPAPLPPAPAPLPPAQVPVAAVPPARPSVPVTIQDFQFQPANINVQVGDTVMWTNSGRTAHTVTSDSNAFDSGRLNAGQTFSFTFSNV